MQELRPFHLAVPVHDLANTRSFYGDMIGCREGRSAAQWVDFDFFGHQFVCHLDEGTKAVEAMNNVVDGDSVPVPHFGIILKMEDWKSLRERLKSADINFVIEPRIRFQGEAGEQATMFFTDPSGNALEFKAFGNDSQIFAK